MQAHALQLDPAEQVWNDLKTCTANRCYWARGTSGIGDSTSMNIGPSPCRHHRPSQEYDRPAKYLELRTTNSY
jgi:hypothetical protein